MKTSLYKDDINHLFSICKDHKKDADLSRLYVVFFAGSAYACALNGHTLGAYKLCNECIDIEENKVWSITFSELSDLVALKQDRSFFIFENGELRAECGRISIPFQAQEGINLCVILDRASSYFSEKNLDFSQGMALLHHSGLDLVLPAKRKNSYYILQKKDDLQGMQIFIPDCESHQTPYLGICMPMRIDDRQATIEKTTTRGRKFFNIAD